MAGIIDLHNTVVKKKNRLQERVEQILSLLRINDINYLFLGDIIYFHYERQSNTPIFQIFCYLGLTHLDNVLENSLGFYDLFLGKLNLTQTP